jgi:hypothetical protein
MSVYAGMAKPNKGNTGQYIPPNSSAGFKMSYWDDKPKPYIPKGVPLEGTPLGTASYWQNNRKSTQEPEPEYRANMKMVSTKMKWGGFDPADQPWDERKPVIVAPATQRVTTVTPIGSLAHTRNAGSTLYSSAPAHSRVSTVTPMARVKKQESVVEQVF